MTYNELSMMEQMKKIHFRLDTMSQQIESLVSIVETLKSMTTKAQRKAEEEYYEEPSLDVSFCTRDYLSRNNII